MPVRRAAGDRQPAGRHDRDREQPHRADDYPHHITSEYLDGYRAPRIEELLASASATRSTTSSASRRTCSRSPARDRHRLSRLHPAGQPESARSSGCAAGTAPLDPDTIAGTIYAAFTTALRARRRGGGDRRRGGRALDDDVGLGCSKMTSSPWRFQARLLELWDEGDPSGSLSDPAGRDWDDLALESLARRSPSSSSARPRPGRLALGTRARARSRTRSARPTALLRALFDRRVAAGGARRP